MSDAGLKIPFLELLSASARRVYDALVSWHPFKWAEPCSGDSRVLLGERDLLPTDSCAAAQLDWLSEADRELLEVDVRPHAEELIHPRRLERGGKSYTEKELTLSIGSPPARSGSIRHRRLK